MKAQKCYSPLIIIEIACGATGRDIPIKGAQAARAIQPVCGGMVLRSVATIKL
jgi:hypothetical protein